MAPSDPAEKGRSTCLTKQAFGPLVFYRNATRTLIDTPPLCAAE